MKIEYDLTKEDYVAFNMHYLESSPTLKRSLFLQRYVLSLVFVIAPFVIAMVSDIPLTYWLVIYGLVFILWILFYPKYFMATTKKRILRMINEGKNANLFGCRSMTLTETGIEEVSGHGESSSSWSSIEKIDETADHIYIFISSMNAYIVPVRVFDSEEKKKEFIQILQSNKK